MSRNASELCVLLVDDIYGELASRIFRILLRHGRLSLPAIQQHTNLPPRFVIPGISGLIENQLVVWYTSSEGSTVFEANAEAAYALVRSGKYAEIAKKQVGDFAGFLVLDLVHFGHARVGDLLKAYGVGDIKVPIIARNGFSKKSLSNGVNHAGIHTGDKTVTREIFNQTLCDLLRRGLVSQVNESHFRSDADNRLEAEKLVPPPEYYKAKSKRENEAQWEASIMKKLEEWKYGRTTGDEHVKFNVKGKKHLLEDAGSLGARKRQRFNPDFSNDSLDSMGSPNGLKTEYEGSLANDLVLRVNDAKFAVIMRNSSLIQLARESICASTSDIYAMALHELEIGIKACRNDFSHDDIYDDHPDLSSLPQVSTGTLVDAIVASTDLANAIGKVDVSMLSGADIDHPKLHGKRNGDNAGDEAMVDGDASSDESEDESDPDNSLTSFSGGIDEDKTDRGYARDAYATVLNDSHRETIRNHLLLLARHPYRFLEHLPETAIEPERWTVVYRPLVEKLAHNAILKIITARYGMPAARLTRLLCEKGKTDEKHLQSYCLMNQKIMRSYLATLHGAGILELQEVPRDNSRNPQRTLFFWHFDLERCKSKLLQELYKTMARFLQRAKVECDKVKGTIEKATRSDVVGREEELLALQERDALKRWRAMEQKILGEIKRLDDLVGIIRDF